MTSFQLPRQRRIRCIVRSCFCIELSSIRTSQRRCEFSLWTTSKTVKHLRPKDLRSFRPPQQWRHRGHGARLCLGRLHTRQIIHLHVMRHRASSSSRKIYDKPVRNAIGQETGSDSSFLSQLGLYQPRYSTAATDSQRSGVFRLKITEVQAVELGRRRDKMITRMSTVWPPQVGALQRSLADLVLVRGNGLKSGSSRKNCRQAQAFPG